MKVTFAAGITSFIEDFSAFRKNRNQFELWLKTRKANLQVSAAIEEGIAKAHGEEFAIHAGQVYLTCDCDDKECNFGDWADGNLVMDLMRDSKFIHKDCKSKIHAEHLGELGNFHVIRVIK